jgi:SNF2 family DNA or RNA helicase
MVISWHLTHEKYGCEPWAVQRAALDYSEGKGKFAHFLEQGLGKTGLSLNEFVHYHERGEVDLLLIVCPNSFKLTWIEALKEWGLGHLPSGVWPGAFPAGKSPAAYVMNWEALRTEAGVKFLKSLKRKVFLVYDETSYIANPTAQVTKAAMHIARAAKMVRLLNGTPQTHSVMDYYGQLKCLDELDGFLASTFKGRFAIITTQTVFTKDGDRAVQSIVGTKNEEELARILARCSFRATKAEWRKDLPPRIISTVQVEMTAAQKRHYKEMKREFLTIVDATTVKAELILTQLAKLRQLSSGIAIQDGKEVILEKLEHNPKLLAFLDLFYGQTGKVIAVYNYKLTGKMLGEICNKKGIKFAYIQGQMAPQELEFQKRAFNEAPECRVILCQQAAACMGHTLLGGTGIDRCATMIFVENSFSLRDRLQMLDRNHRGEQDQACTVYDLVASAVERKIIRGLNTNKAAADMMDEIVTTFREI